jgi:superfamily I DNA/RNA helicase
MELVRDTVLSLRISQHASVALAYRYGIICQASTINFYYQTKGKDNQDGSLTAKGVIDNVKVEIVIYGSTIKTALPTQKEFKTKVGVKSRDLIEGAFWGSDRFTLQHVVDLRNKYLESPKSMTVASLRKEISLISKQLSADDSDTITVHPPLKPTTSVTQPAGTELLVPNNEPDIADSITHHDPWITGDELYFLEVPETEWKAIITSSSIVDLPDLNVSADVVSRINQYCSTGEKTDIEKLYALNSEDSSLNVSGRPLQDFMIDLDPEQKKILSKIKEDGPYLIKGGAGTGKSIVGLYHIRDVILSRANESLFDYDTASYGVITYTNTLVDSNSAILESIMPGNVDTLVNHTTLDKLTFKLASTYLGISSRNIVNKRLDSSGISNWLSRFVKPSQSAADWEIISKLGCDYVAEEIEQIIYGNNISILDDYLTQSRRGRKRRLRANERQAVWNSYTAFSEICASKGVTTFGMLRVAALKQLDKDPMWPRYNALFVDEAQDLSKVSRLLCLGLVKNAQSLIMAADTAQSIYTVPPTWSETHKSFDFRRRRPLKLEKSYRSTAEISEAIEPLRLDPGDDDDKSMIPKPVRSGPKPSWVELPLALQGDGVCEIVLSYIRNDKKSVNAGQIAIIVADNKRAEFYLKALRLHDLPAQIVGKGRPILLNGSCVHIVTAHSSKGLGFPVVIVPDVHSDFYPSRISLAQCIDDQQKEQVFENQQRVLYVALSRASSFLHMVVDPHNPSQFVEKLYKSQHWE